MLNEPFMPENEPCDDRNCHRKNHSEDKSPRCILHAVHQIHAEQRGDERGAHHHDRHRRQRTHHRIHIIINNRGIGVHRRLQDVGVDRGGLAGLRHLDVHVLDEVGIEFVDLQFELQLLQQVLVAADGGLEVGERVLQTAEAYQTLVVHLLVEVTLGLVDEH